MKIVSFMSAVTSFNAPWDEVRPIDGRSLSAVQLAMRQRYGFQTVGQSVTSQQAGLTTPNFATGQFQIDGRAIPINQFEFQPAGVVVTCATTAQTYKVAEEVFAFLADSFQFRIPDKNRPRQFMTTLTVDFGPKGIPLFEKWTKVQSLINEAFGKGDELVPFGVRFVAIKPDSEPVLDRQFIFEKRAVNPPGQNWIYSQANIDTDSHVKLLTEMDAVLNG